MVIRRLKIKNFGKIRDKDMELSPGINVLYGENESGKTTTHTFIRSMFYGVRTMGKSGRIWWDHVVHKQGEEVSSYQEFL